MQRGFTRNSSPLYCALIIEEFIIPYTAYLDAKTAFDVVSHNSLMMKLFNAGVEGKLWSLIMNFHQDALSVVKWEGRFASTFPILQGVRQGGILSADLYKLYVNQLLNRLESNSTGCWIGDIVCNAPTCADDLSTLGDSERSLQVLCNIAYDYSVMEQYQLQPTKSVVLSVQTGRKKIQPPSCFLGRQLMPVVDKIVHVGVTRITSNKPSGIIEENIQKARRTMYSLMATELHGRNGLDPETSIHIMKIYVIPVLTYGLEIYLPTSSELKNMDIILTYSFTSCDESRSCSLYTIWISTGGRTNPPESFNSVWKRCACRCRGYWEEDSD